VSVPLSIESLLLELLQPIIPSVSNAVKSAILHIVVSLKKKFI
jgi:hypothetical protein